MTLIKEDGSKEVFEPSGIVPRLSTKTEPAGKIGEIPVVRNTMGRPENVPEPKEGTAYIVSFLVASALPERDDLIAPDTTPDSVVRDENGRIVGVKRFQKV